MIQTQTPITIYAEQEHAGIRAVVVLSMALSYILCFWLINSLSQLLPERIASFSLTLACILAIPLAIGISWLLEKWLKQVWHSGYSISMERETITVNQPEFNELNFDLSRNFVNLNWYFKLAGYKRGGRERRVPEKWLCLCCQLQQDARRLIVYTFASPQKTAVYQNDHTLQFEKLNPVDVYSSNLRNQFSPPTRPSKLPPEIISGKNGRYWLAEQNRWTEGLEITFADFETFLAYLQTHNR